eukprot:COSAG04_NODE_651_length_11559_cov_6.052880_9_plen_191_part_00
MFSVVGTSFNQAKDMTSEEMRAIKSVWLQEEPDNEHDKRAIAVFFEDGGGARRKMGYVPRSELASAHRDRWAQRAWVVADAGTHRPSARTLPYCRLRSPRAAVVASLRNDSSLYSGSALVAILYEKKDGSRGWRDVVPLTSSGEPWRDATGFRAMDGERDARGSLKPKKFIYRQVLDAALPLEAQVWGGV